MLAGMLAAARLPWSFTRANRIARRDNAPSAGDSDIGREKSAGPSDVARTGAGATASGIIARPATTKE
jgi:hypothetical protein